MISRFWSYLWPSNSPTRTQGENIKAKLNYFEDQQKNQQAEPTDFTYVTITAPSKPNEMSIKLNELLKKPQIATKQAIEIETKPNEDATTKATLRPDVPVENLVALNNLLTQLKTTKFSAPTTQPESTLQDTTTPTQNSAPTLS